MGGKWWTIMAVAVTAGVQGCASEPVGGPDFSTRSGALSASGGSSVTSVRDEAWTARVPERGVDRDPPRLHRQEGKASAWMRMDLSKAINEDAILCQQAIDGKSACNDGNPCTIEDCDSEIGCVYQLVKNGTVCNDGSVCSLSEECSFGKCKGVAFLCDDGNVCTYDGCKEDGTCHPKALSGTACKDGDLCNSWDTCVQGTCKGIPKNCDDGDPTTMDYCNPADGLCVNATAT